MCYHTTTQILKSTVATNLHKQKLNGRAAHYISLSSSRCIAFAVSKRTYKATSNLLSLWHRGMDSSLPKFFRGKTVFLLQQWCHKTTTNLLTELCQIKASRSTHSTHPCRVHPHSTVLSPSVPWSQTLSKQLVLLFVLMTIDPKCFILHWGSLKPLILHCSCP